MAAFFDQIVGYLTTDEVIDRLVADQRPVDHEAVQVGAVLAAAAVLFELAPKAAATEAKDWLSGLGDGGRRHSPPSLSAPGPVARRRGAAQARVLWGGRMAGIASLVGKQAELDDETAADLLAITTWVTAAHLADRAASPSDGPVALEVEVDDLRSEGWDLWLHSLEKVKADTEPEFERRRSMITAGMLAALLVVGAAYITVQIGAGGGPDTGAEGGAGADPTGPSRAGEGAPEPPTVGSTATTGHP